MRRIEVNGLQFDVRPNTSDEQAIKEVITNKGYQRKYFQIKPDERWLDLGANIGAFSVLAASKGAQVVAYEPEPENAALALNNIAINHLPVTLHQKAIVADSVTQPELNFYLSNTDYGRWRHSLYKTKNKHRITVPTARISDVLTAIDAIKMDIEGAEIDILFSIASFQNVRKLVFEYHFDVNKSIPLFLQIMQRLKSFFAHVHYGKMPEGVEEYSFYPPARVVFCWNE